MGGGVWQCRVTGPALALTLVLFHEGPHVPLLRAVCKGAVPHVLALAAALRVDAELQGGHGENRLSPTGFWYSTSLGPLSRHI